jgi:hypothetical protein
MQTKSAAINTCIYNITIKCHFGAKGLFQKTIKNKIERVGDIFTLAKKAYKIVHFCIYFWIQFIVVEILVLSFRDRLIGRPIAIQKEAKRER